MADGLPQGERPVEKGRVESSVRIVHVSDAYLPKQGGIEVQVHDLAQRQAQAGHRVRVLTCAPDGAATAGAGAATPPGTAARNGDEPVAVTRVGSPWGRVRAANEAMYAVLRREQPDVVHAHLSVLSPLAILAVRAAHRERVPVVMTLHSLWWLATPLYVAAHVLLGWGRWRVHWTAVSELAAAPLRRVVGDRGELSLLPNGVEPLQWEVDPVDRDPRDVVVVSVMRLAARKRPRPLLRALRDAVDRLPHGVRLTLVVVGDGPQRERLEADVRRLGLQEHVQLRGRMDRHGIRELYRRADVYVAPATLESFGIAALEARCAGLPVVARTRTGIADFVEDGVHGLLAPSDAAMADALVRLAADAPLRGLIAATNRACAPETGWNDVLQRCELAYKVAGELTRD